MIDNIDDPVATARVTWLTPAEGGRRSGPPTAPVYASNCAFPMGGEDEVVPGWPATAEKFSLLLQKVGEEAGGEWRCRLDFLARDLVRPYLVSQAQMLVMEGPRVVGRAVIQDVLTGDG